MATTGHVTGSRESDFETNISRQSGHSINMAKLMALSIMAYLPVPLLVFFAADRAFDSNWPSVLGFLLDAAGCVLLARMITWASRNL